MKTGDIGKQATDKTDKVSLFVRRHGGKHFGKTINLPEKEIGKSTLITGSESNENDP